MSNKRIRWVALVFVCFSIQRIYSTDLIEEERIAEYEKRGYTFPPSYVPDTPGWRELFDRRFSQVEHIKDAKDRYQGWLVSALSAYVQKNYTETGWALTRAPEDLTAALRRGIQQGLPNVQIEHNAASVEGDDPWFIHKQYLNDRVLREMEPMLEAWSGIDLNPIAAYGLRLYRNNSRLTMHLDRPDTHVISCILHIDSSEDAEPWPLIIEDFQGNTNEVILTSGDVLLYESSKCFHGRPHKFNGSWYSSIFVHFNPASKGWADMDHVREGHYGIPSHWIKEATTDPIYPDLEMRGAAFTEPECENGWCSLENTVKWFGPGEEGYLLTTGNHRYPLYGRSQSHKEL